MRGLLVEVCGQDVWMGCGGEVILDEHESLRIVVCMWKHGSSELSRRGFETTLTRTWFCSLVLRR